MIRAPLIVHHPTELIDYLAAEKILNRIHDIS
ncbi:hypothetical protein NTGZN8_60037 [Candidatus Nitrotoga fabula]|uniref:Uncharacterized protein n=1 Tax=Candidatus Nitrotoga fabula TaxID=2182327 RepID=A0A916F9L6_9PROT|nr:hypothetical protein NTGZN8_60037 [Candidatus Nitrotoga fabula]